MKKQIYKAKLRPEYKARYIRKNFIYDIRGIHQFDQSWSLSYNIIKDDQEIGIMIVAFEPYTYQNLPYSIWDTKLHYNYEQQKAYIDMTEATYMTTKAFKTLEELIDEYDKVVAK